MDTGKSEPDPNIIQEIYSGGFVFNILVEAATVNDPATGEACVQISRQMRTGSFALKWGRSAEQLPMPKPVIPTYRLPQSNLVPN